MRLVRFPGPSEALERSKALANCPLRGFFFEGLQGYCQDVPCQSLPSDDPSGPHQPPPSLLRALSLSLFTFSLAQRRRVGLHLEPCLERVSGHLPRQCGARLPSQRGPGGTVTMNVEGTVTKSTCHVPRATVRNWGLVREDWWCR